VLVAPALVLQFFWFVPLVREVGEDGWSARADVTAAHTFATRVPPGGLVLTHNPSMFLLLGVNAAQMSFAVTEPAFARDIITASPGRPVFFHFNFWCTVADPVQAGFCRDFQARFPLTLVAEYRERAARYAIYRVTGPTTRLRP